MQPKQRFKQTLLAGAFIIGAGNSFYASATLFPVTAGAIPDVTAGPVSGFTELSFGEGIIGNKVGDTCSMNGSTGIADVTLQFDVGQDNGLTAEDPLTYGALSGAACVAGGFGVPMVIEIEGATGSSVTVTVSDVVGANYTYTPTAESCVVKYNGDDADDADACVPLTNNTVSGILMSLAQVDGNNAGTENNALEYGFSAAEGTARMVLAGSITIDSEIAAGTAIADSVIVQVTYE